MIPKGPEGPTLQKSEASQLVSAFQAFDSTQRFLPGPDSPGKGCVGLPGLNRNLTRFDFTVFLLVKILHSVAFQAFCNDTLAFRGLTTPAWDVSALPGLVARPAVLISFALSCLIARFSQEDFGNAARSDTLTVRWQH